MESKLAIPSHLTGRLAWAASEEQSGCFQCMSRGLALSARLCIMYCGTDADETESRVLNNT